MRQASDLVKQTSDFCVWWNGPEHIPAEDLPKALEELKSLCNKAIFWACPWGSFYVNGVGDYLGDEHHFHPENEHFTDLGMQVFNTGGKKDASGANIVAHLFKGAQQW